MAQTTYSRWFNQFEFPNDDGLPYQSSGGKMVWNDELKREIPAGWLIKKIGDFCECVLGGTPSRDHPEYWNGNVNWINSGKVNDFRINAPSEYISNLGIQNSSTKLLPTNTTVLAITGATLGQISITNIETCANQSVVGILENLNLHTSFIYPMVNYNIKKLTSIKTGNTQQHITKEDVANLKFCCPPTCLLNKFYTVVDSQYQQILYTERSTVELLKLKRFLLPLLVNGQLKM